MRSFLVAVDLGATNVRVVLGEETKIISSLLEATDTSHGAEGVPNQIVRMIMALMSRFQVKEVRSIGVGSIGPLDLKKGVIVLSLIHI